MKITKGINLKVGILGFALVLLIGGLIIPFKSDANSFDNKEVKNIDGQIRKIKEKAFVTKRGAKVINAEESKEIHVLQRGKLNLINGVEDIESPINKGNFMMVTGNSTMKIKKDLLGKEKEVIYEEIINVLDNVELDDRYIENLTFIVSPYELSGINGFTLAKTKNNDLKQYVVISYSPGYMELGGDIHRELIRSTILHELGHTYKNKLEKEEGKSFEDNYRKYYREIDTRDMEENHVQKWKNSESENFAEDFKVYYSDKLKDFSFTAKEKKTKMPYNHEVHDLFQIYSVN